MLDEQRTRIDIIDDEIARLFTERLSVTAEVAKIKKDNGLPILNSEREQEIISRLTDDQPEEIAGCIKNLFMTIFDISRTRQAELIGSMSETKTT